MSREILLVTKPLAPPWNDSGKVYVRSLVDHLPHRCFRALVPRGHPYPAQHVISEGIYRDVGGHAPGASQNIRVLLRLLRPDRRASLFHFFFAPNPRTSRAARFASRITRTCAVQTVLSVPKTFDRVDRLLFGDRVVVLSDDTRSKLRRAGVRGVVRIYPGVEIGDPVSAGRRQKVRLALGLADAPVVLYPGDLEFSSGARTVIEAAAEILRGAPTTRLVLACRPKTAAAHLVATRLRELVGGEPRVVFAGDVPDMRALVATSDVVVLPAESTYAKTDLPLVLLEALAEGVPVIVGDRPPLAEVLGDEASGGAGFMVPTGSPEALAGSVLEVLGDPDARAAMGRRARRLAQTRFSATEMANAYDRVYTELLG